MRCVDIDSTDAHDGAMPPRWQLMPHHRTQVGRETGREWGGTSHIDTCRQRKRERERERTGPSAMILALALPRLA